MPLFDLRLKATLESVGKVYAPDTMFWKLRFTCCSCNELSQTMMEFSAQEEMEVGKAKANLVSKCHCCKRARTVLIVPKSDQAYCFGDQPNFKRVIKFDCRGMEPAEFSPGEGWVVESESGEVFNDVDLTESEWVDYDTKQQCPVGVFSLEYQFVKG